MEAPYETWGELIGGTLGDFATTAVDGSFSVAYLLFNTIINLTTQAAQVAQVACFRNVADLQRLPPGETIRASHVSATKWGFDEYDVAAQSLTSHHFETVGGRLAHLSIPFRDAWPAELDLMVRLAGMSLRERWGGWKTRALHEREPRAHLSLEEATRYGLTLHCARLDVAVPRYVTVHVPSGFHPAVAIGREQ